MKPSQAPGGAALNRHRGADVEGLPDVTRDEGPRQPSPRRGLCASSGCHLHGTPSQGKVLLWLSAAVAQACLPPVTCHQVTVTVLTMLLSLLLGAPGVGCGNPDPILPGAPPRDSSIPAEGRGWIQAVGTVLG